VDPLWPDRRTLRSIAFPNPSASDGVIRPQPDFFGSRKRENSRRRRGVNRVLAASALFGGTARVEPTDPRAAVWVSLRGTRDPTPHRSPYRLERALVAWRNPLPKRWEAQRPPEVSDNTPQVPPALATKHERRCCRLDGRVSLSKSHEPEAWHRAEGRLRSSHRSAQDARGVGSSCFDEWAFSCQDRSEDRPICTLD
jgi:hypothetical protein